MCASRVSTRPKALMVGRVSSRSSFVNLRMLMRRRKSSTVSPEKYAADPPVGKTWLGPATKSPTDSGVHFPIKRAPTLMIFSIHFSGEFTISSMCSGANLLQSLIPSFIFLTTTRSIPFSSTCLMDLFFERFFA